MDASLRPDDFARAMQAHWTNNLGNVSSPALMSLWEMMGDTFNKAIEANPSTVNPFQTNNEEGKWLVLSPATGSGKTQGVRLYSAMQAVANLTRPSEDKVGVLVVAREIEQADELAKDVQASFGEIMPPRTSNNKKTLEPQGGIMHNPAVALARHSQNASTVSLEDMRRADVLVVTHAAYVQALDKLSQDIQDRWSSLIEWEHGQRRLVVVDETVSNLVESYRLELDYLSRTVGEIGQDVKDRFPGQTKLLEGVLAVLRTVRAKTKAEAKVVEDDEGNEVEVVTNRSDLAVWNADRQREPKIDRVWSEAIKSCDLSDFRKAVKEDRKKAEGWNWRHEGGLAQHRLRSEAINNDLKSVQAICSRWAWYARSGKYDTINSSRLVLPEPFPLNVVCLDATAGQEVLWKLLGKERVVRPRPPEGVRSYANVTLNVARVSGGGLGKEKMAEKGKARLARLIEHLNQRFEGQTDKKVFLVVHKAIEHLAKDHLLSFGKLSVAHWGSLDGKNDWSDHDTAVLFGLSYRSRVWANNLYQAINGRQDTEWLQTNNDLRNEMEVKQLTAAIVQAINRIRCRRVTDDKGNCPESEVFIVLRKGSEGDAILQGIKDEMPGVVVKDDWSFQLDGERATIRKGSSHEGLITLMENAPAYGEWSMSSIEREFSLTRKGAEKLRATLNDPSSPLSRRLTELGVTYVPQGYGRGFRASLVKRPVSAPRAAA